MKKKNPPFLLHYGKKGSKQNRADLTNNLQTEASRCLDGNFLCNSQDRLVQSMNAAMHIKLQNNGCLLISEVETYGP
jgi:hypothetical protein